MKAASPTSVSVQSKPLNFTAPALFLAGVAIPFATFWFDNALHPEGTLLPGQPIWWLRIALAFGCIATAAAPLFLRIPFRAFLTLPALFAYVVAAYIASCAFFWPYPSFANRKEEARIREIVASVGAPTLLADAARLARELPKEVHLVDPSVWPASFKAFSPKNVRRFDDGFLIVTYQWVSHLVGVSVMPPGYPKPESDRYHRNVKIAHRIYFHSS